MLAASFFWTVARGNRFNPSGGGWHGVVMPVRSIFELRVSACGQFQFECGQFGSPEPWFCRRGP